MRIERIESTSGINHRCAGIEGNGHAQSLGNLFLACGGVHGHTTVAMSGDRHCQHDELSRFGAQQIRFVTCLGKRLVTRQRVRAEHAELTNAPHQFLAVFRPVLHKSDPL
jgi:hypothetical protein